MINWYENDELAIFFNHKPNTHMLDIVPSMSQAEKDLVELYPFINCTSLKVGIYDKRLPKMYNFDIPKHFRPQGNCLYRFQENSVGAKRAYRTILFG
jgi:hypothetical protein